MRLQLKNEVSIDNYDFSSKTEASVSNCGFSSKMKSQLSIEVLTKILRKNVYIYITWLLCGTKETNLNISFIKWLDPIFFLYKWVILTQNSNNVSSATQWHQINSTGVKCNSCSLMATMFNHRLKNQFLSAIFRQYIRYLTAQKDIEYRLSNGRNIEKISGKSSKYWFWINKWAKKSSLKPRAEEACQNIKDISTNISDISPIYMGNIEDFFESLLFFNIYHFFIFQLFIFNLFLF